MNKRIGFIGCGNMGEALLKGLLDKGLFKRQQIIVSDNRALRRAYIKRTYSIKAVSNKDAAERCDIIILAVKPQDMDSVLKELAGGFKSKLIISIAAGVTIDSIKRKTKSGRIVRVMPNLAAVIGESMSAMASARGTRPGDKDTAEAIFRCIGKVGWLPEKDMDVITAVSGSGPAYFFLLMEAMIEAAVSCGLPGDIARNSVRQTAYGAAKFVMDTQNDISLLREKVTSKGGVTEAALKVFKQRKVKKIVEDAIRAAVRRSKELSQ